MDHEYTFPKWVYHQSTPPKVIYTGVEWDRLKSEGWADNPAGPFVVEVDEDEALLAEAETVIAEINAGAPTHSLESVERSLEPKRRGRKPKAHHGNR